MINCVLFNYTCHKLSFRATTRFTPQKSHSSGVCGLVVICLLFNPEGSCSNPCVCANFLQVFRSRRFSLFSALWDFPPFGFVSFFEIFSRSPKGVVFNFLIFCYRMNVKKSQRFPFYSFPHCEIFQNEWFRLKLGFLRPSTLYPTFFYRAAFLHATFLHMTKSMCIAVQLSKFFFHYSQLHNERLLDKSQNPSEIRTCSLPIARHKSWPLCHRDVIE